MVTDLTLGGLTWLRWLAPAAGCLVLALLTLAEHDRELARATASRDSRMLSSLILSNKNFAAEVPVHFEFEASTLLAVTFDWTNVSRSPSSMGSLPLLRTNSSRL